MGRFTLGFGLGFISGVAAVPVVAILVLDNAKEIELTLKKGARAFEKFNDETIEETAPANESPFQTPEGSPEA